MTNQGHGYLMSYNYLTGGRLCQVAKSSLLAMSTESPFRTAHGLQSNFSPTASDPLTEKIGGKNQQLFGKISSDATTTCTDGQPLMDLMLRLSW